MRLLLLVLAVLGALVAAGWWLVTAVAGTTLIGFFGMGLLLIALCWPRRGSACAGLHCSGCSDRTH